MTRELQPGEWDALTKIERVALCRRSADEARREAHLQGPGPQGDLASQWQMLAVEIERSR